MADQVEKVVLPGLPADAPAGGAVKQGNSVVITVKIHRETYDRLMAMYGGSPGRSDLIAWMIERTLRPQRPPLTVPANPDSKIEPVHLVTKSVTATKPANPDIKTEHVTQEPDNFSMSDIFLK